MSKHKMSNSSIQNPTNIIIYKKLLISIYDFILRECAVVNVCISQYKNCVSLTQYLCHMLNTSCLLHLFQLYLSSLGHLLVMALLYSMQLAQHYILL